MGDDRKDDLFRHAQTLTSSHSTRSALPRTVLGVEGNRKPKCHTFASHTRITSIGTQIPYVKHFVLSKSTQYRKLKTEWRQNVFLAKSRIQVRQIFFPLALIRMHFRAWVSSLDVIWKNTPWLLNTSVN